MGTLYSKIEKGMDCPKEVVIWNYWDREHLAGTHYLHYSWIRVLAEKDDWCLAESSVRLPIIPISVTTRNFAYMVAADHMRTIHIGKLATLEQDFRFEDDGPECCRVILENRMRVPLPAFIIGWLQPVWRRFTTKWFFATWEEDVPMRQRRWKVWKLGFRDFSGIDYINQKKAKPEGRGNAPRYHPVKLPVTKSTPIGEEGWPRLFSKSVEVGYGNTTDSA